METFILRLIAVFEFGLLVLAWTSITDKEEILSEMSQQTEVLTNELNLLIEENGQLKSEVMELEKDRDFFERQINDLEEKVFYCELNTGED
jgi:regulator of replication initiation timing